MSLTFGIPNEVDVGSILTIAGVYIGVTGNRFQYGSGSNSTLMVSDSGAWCALTALTANSGVLAAQTAASGSMLYNYATSGFAASGQALFTQLTGLGGTLNGTIQNTGQQLYVLYTGLGGNLVVTNANLTATGQVFINIVNAFAATNLITSGILASGIAATGATLTALVAASGQQAWIAANTNSIAQSGNLTASGAALYADITAFSGAVQAQLNTFSGIFRSGSFINFDLRSNILLATGIENQFISFSSGFGAVPFVLYSITNSSGNPILAHQLSGITTNGFNLAFSAAPLTPGYLLSYMATTGQGFTPMGNGSTPTTIISVVGTGALVTVSGSQSMGAANFIGQGGTTVTQTSGNNIVIGSSTNVVATTGNQVVSGTKTLATQPIIEGYYLSDIVKGQSIITTPSAPGSGNFPSGIYYYVATLPTSTSSTADLLSVNILGGGWGGNTKFQSNVMLSNRNGFTYRWNYNGMLELIRSAPALGINAYNSSSGVDVYLYLNSNQFLQVIYSAQGANSLTNGNLFGVTGANTFFTVGAPTSGVPTGAIVFSTLQPTVYRPYLDAGGNSFIVSSDFEATGRIIADAGFFSGTGGNLVNISTLFDAAGTAANTGFILSTGLSGVNQSILLGYNDPLIKSTDSYLRFQGTGLQISDITFGSGNFSVFANVYTTQTGAALGLIGGVVSGFALYIGGAQNRLGARSVNVAGGFSSPYLLNLNQWYAVGYVKSGVSGSFYINGNLDSTFPDTGNYAATRWMGCIGPINVSGPQFGYTNNVVIYSGMALSSTQVQNLIFQGTDIGMPPTADYTAGIISGNILYDRSPNANNATIPTTVTPVLFNSAITTWANNQSTTISGELLMTSGLLTSGMSSINACAFENYLYFQGTGFNMPPVVFGSGDFSIFVDIYPLHTGRMFILGGSTSGFSFSTDTLTRLTQNRSAIATDVTSTTVLSPNQWYAAGYTRTNGVGTIYLNGFANKTGTDTGFYAGTTSIIGGSTVVGTVGWTGFLKDVIVYSGSGLSPQQVYNLGLYGPSPVIPATIDYTQGIASGVTLYDRSPNGFNATIPTTVIPVLFNIPVTTLLIGMSGAFSNAFVTLSGTQSITGIKTFTQTIQTTNLTVAYNDNGIATFDVAGSNRAGFIKSFGFAPIFAYTSGLPGGMNFWMANQTAALTLGSISGGSGQSVMLLDQSGNVQIGKGGYISGSAPILWSQSGFFSSGTAIRVSGSNLFAALTITGTNNTTAIVSGSTLIINSTTVGGYATAAFSYVGTGISFNLSNPTGYYTWSGSGTGASGGIPMGIQATGILPPPSSLSGYAITVKNASPSGQLLISGYIDHAQNIIIYPLGSYDFWSDANTWNVT